MKGTRFIPVTIVLVILLALSAGLSAAQGPAPQNSGHTQAPVGSAFTYQGQLQKDGSPINATCAMTFTLYDDATAGNLLDSISSNVEVSDGLFTQALDLSSSLFTGDARWLEVAVKCPGDAAASTLTPRQALTAAPYALSLQPGAVIRGELAGDSALLVQNTVPSSGIALYGQGPNAVVGDSSAPGYAAVMGRNLATTGTGSGVYGEAYSTSGRGVFGHAAASTGNTYGVYGSSDSTDGCGVLGYADSPSGETRGVRGVVHSSSGVGVFGFNSSGSSGVGVYGKGPNAVVGESSTPGYGAVVGRNFATTGAGTGVYGSSASPEGYGVYGYTAATDGYGVYGYASDTSGGAAGVVGRVESTDGWAVYAWGKMGASGTKSAVVQTQGYGYRCLYTLESPEVRFEDVGTARLVNGQAVVVIDPVFAQTVNLEQPYQVFLTPQGDCGLYVAEKTATSFTVRALDGQTCSIAFDYRIIAKRLGYEDVRLEPAQPPARAQNQPLGFVEP